MCSQCSIIFKFDYSQLYFEVTLNEFVNTVQYTFHKCKPTLEIIVNINTAHLSHLCKCYKENPHSLSTLGRP